MELDKAKKILCKNQKINYSDKEIEQIIHLLETYAHVVCNNYLTKNNGL
jgi:hypothetical protein